jgi:hypothetical protein
MTYYENFLTVPNREYKEILFNPEIKYVGISCGWHKWYGDFCCLDYAEEVEEIEE